METALVEPASRKNCGSSGIMKVRYGEYVRMTADGNFDLNGTVKNVNVC